MKRLKIVFFNFAAMILIYSCTKDVTENSVNATIPVPEPLGIEKQHVIYDESGNNSVTVRISSDDETLLANYTVKNYELLINPVIPEEFSVETSKYEQGEDPFELPDSIPLTGPVIRIDLIKNKFNNKVKNYALAIHGSSMTDEDKVEYEEECKGGLCLWYPRDYQYYYVDAWGATKVKVTFNRTKKTCNNIKYYVCKYNTTDAYVYHHLKHPGDVATTFTQSGQDGITLLYKHYKNQIPTYTFYYE